MTGPVVTTEQVLNWLYGLITDEPPDHDQPVSFQQRAAGMMLVQALDALHRSTTRLHLAPLDGDILYRPRFRDEGMNDGVTAIAFDPLKPIWRYLQERFVHIPFIIKAMTLTKSEHGLILNVFLPISNPEEDPRSEHGFVVVTFDTDGGHWARKYQSNGPDHPELLFEMLGLVVSTLPEWNTPTPVHDDELVASLLALLAKMYEMYDLLNDQLQRAIDARQGDSAN